MVGTCLWFYYCCVMVGIALGIFSSIDVQTQHHYQKELLLIKEASIEWLKFLPGLNVLVSLRDSLSGMDLRAKWWHSFG